MKQQLLGILVLLLAAACSPEAQPVQYGSDQCHSCRMTIVDKAHAAEVVTTKSKAYKFDSGECMIRFVGNNESEYSMILVNDFNNPGNLVNARACTYLVSPNIPSPMGANLSAFEKAEQAQQLLQEKGGVLYTWKEIKQHLSKQ